jgi:hypothetical protein
MTLVVVQTLLEVLLNMPLRSAHFTGEAFLVKSKTSSLGTTLLKCEIFKISELLNLRLREFCFTLLPTLASRKAGNLQGGI